MDRPRPPGGERRARSTVVTVLGFVALLVAVAVVAMAVAPGLLAPQAGPPASTTDDATPDAGGQPADGDTATAGDVDGTDAQTDAGASSSDDAGASTATPAPDANATGSDGTATDSAGAASEGSASGGASTDDDGTDGAASGGADGDGSGGGGSDAADETTTGPRFSLVVGEVTECGAVCRDVTATVTNEGDERATGVTVETRVFAGGDRVWRGTADLGTVDAGESVTRTQRVNVGYFGAAKIQANDGRVTIRTTVRWDGGEETFSERVDVS